MVTHLLYLHLPEIWIIVLVNVHLTREKWINQISSINACFAINLANTRQWRLLSMIPLLHRFNFKHKFKRDQRHIQLDDKESWQNIHRPTSTEEDIKWTYGGLKDVTTRTSFQKPSYRNEKQVVKTGGSIYLWSSTQVLLTRETCVKRPTVRAKHLPPVTTFRNSQGWSF